MNTVETVEASVNAPIPAIPSEEMAKDIAELENKEEINLTAYDYANADDTAKAEIMEQTGLDDETLSDMSPQDVYDYVHGSNQEGESLEDIEANLSPEERAELEAENIKENLEAMQGISGNSPNGEEKRDSKVLPDLTKGNLSHVPENIFKRPDFAYDPKGMDQDESLDVLCRKIYLKYNEADEEAKGPMYSELVKVLVSILAEYQANGQPLTRGDIKEQVKRVIDEYRVLVIAPKVEGSRERAKKFDSNSTFTQYKTIAAKVALLAFKGEFGITMAMFRQRGGILTAFAKDSPENGTFGLYYGEYVEVAKKAGYIHERLAVPANVAKPILVLDKKLASDTGVEPIQENKSTNLVELTWAVMKDLVALAYNGAVRNPETGKVESKRQTAGSTNQNSSQGTNDKAKESLKEQSLGMLSNVKASLDKNEIKAEQVVTVFDFVNQALKDKALIIGLLKADKDFANMLRDIQSELDTYDEEVDKAAA